MKNYLFLIAMVLCFSCKHSPPQPLEDYYFAEAQPVSGSELPEFPNRFIGRYQAEDSTFLNIGKKLIASESYTRFKISRTAIDSLLPEFDFIGQKLISKETGAYYNVAEQGDSLELSHVEIDTVFDISEYRKIKKIDGHLVLSEKDSSYWKIKWLSLRKDKLKLNFIFSEEDRKRIDSITKTRSAMLDSSKYLIRPTRRELGKILRLKKFGYEQDFIKLKP